MSVIGDLLFWSGRDRAALSDVLRHNLEQRVPQAVNKLPEARLTEVDDEALASLLYEECKAEPLELLRDQAQVDVQETSIEVQSVFGEKVKVPGLRATKSIPFVGEAQFFSLQPNTFDMNPPRGKVRGNTLVVGMEVRETEGDAAVQYIDETLARVETYISRQRTQIDQHNSQLSGAISASLQRRRASLSKASDLVARLRGQ